ncbi:MAG: cation:proton antiporter [Sphingobacteriaceae bacterium]|nr:cation:proton antiporter [Sphingobacteriaceae bacterium]
MSLEYYLLYIILPILVLSALLVFVRFLLGPHLSDRVVSVDLLMTIGVGIVGVYAMATAEATFLDIAMILGLLAFLGTVAFSYYLIKRKKND